MKNYIEKPSKKKHGEIVITNQEKKHCDMQMDISVHLLKEKETKKFYSNNNETAILLIKGKIILEWEGKKKVVERLDTFTDKAICLHVSKEKEVKVTAVLQSEILVQGTKNDKIFKSTLYEKSNYRDEVFGNGVCEDTMIRRVTTFFDYSNEPDSNMVMGEVFSKQGGWSSYVPHSHDQPEVYYYHFSHENGFGACFIGEDVFKINDGSSCMIPGGKTHPQVSAPGYRMYYVWMIKNLPGNPWTSRVNDPKHVWIIEK